MDNAKKIYLIIILKVSKKKLFTTAVTEVYILRLKNINVMGMIKLEGICRW